MPKEIEISEIDFSNEYGKSIETIDTKLSVIKEKLRLLKNPYVGNKRKLIQNIIKILDEEKIQYKSVLDLFSGSACVSMAMKILDKQVIANDLLTSSYFNSVAFVQNDNVELSEQDKESLFKPSDRADVIIPDKYLKRFTPREKSILELYYHNLREQWGNPLEGNMKAILAVVYLQMYIINKCFVGGRLSNNQLLAKVDHRLGHMRNNGIEMFHNGRDFSYNGMNWVKPINVDNDESHFCYNMDAIELLQTKKPQVDLAYIDPPYGGLTSDYGYIYSFFEEMIYGCSYDKIKKEREGYTKFIDKKNYEEHFIKLVESLNYIPTWVISYNDSSWGDINKIISIIKQYRNDIIVKDFEYDYKYRRNKKIKKKGTEYLVIVK